MRALARAALVGLLIVATGCIDASRVNSVCRWSDSPPRTLDLRRAADPKVQDRFEKWELRYRAACEPFATCRFVAEVGSGRTASDVAPVVELHDRESRAESNLPLA
ncbi:MAG TPA: hypothetical protein VF166_11520 [Gemmatimonadaceae bacterium]